MRKRIFTICIVIIFIAFLGYFSYPYIKDAYNENRDSKQTGKNLDEDDGDNDDGDDDDSGDDDDDDGDDDDSGDDDDDEISIISTFLINSVTANLTSPQPVGTKITFTTKTNGALGTQYEYIIEKHQEIIIKKEYSTSSILSWTPESVGDYRIIVHAKNKDSLNEKDAEHVIGFTIGSAVSAKDEAYIIDLEHWGIDGNPMNNSIGINEALIWASKEGYKEIKFPTGEYIISEYRPINIQHMSDITIDLNNSTIAINSNALRSNKIIAMYDIRNVNLINGTILGDINTHDYTTFPGTTEGNLGILIDRGVIDCKLNNVVVKDISGWGIVTSIGSDYLSKRHYVSKNNLESGAYNLSTGAKIADTTKIRTINPIDISEFSMFKDKFFILGYDLGYMNNLYLSTRKYDVIFYDENHNLIGSASNENYKKTYFPPRTIYLDFIIHQPNVPANGDTDFGNAVAFITHRVQPNILIENSVIDNCKSLGMAICGGDGIIVKNCTIKNTQNLAPAFAVDFEDGWEFMNNIQFIGNTFENNGNDLVVCAGDNAVFKENKFSGTIYFYSRATNYSFVDNEFNFPTDSEQSKGVTFYFRSDTVIRGNKYKNAALGVNRESGWGKLVWENETLEDSSINSMNGEDAILKNSSITSNTSIGKRLGGIYDNCTFDVRASEALGLTIKNSTINRLIANQQKTNTYDNCIIKNSNFHTTSSSETIIVKNSTIENSTLSIADWPPPASIYVQNCNVTLTSFAERAFIFFSASKAKDITMLDTDITNNSAFPVFQTIGTAFAYQAPANTRMNLDNIKFIQDDGYVFSGTKLVSGGLIKVEMKNTEIIGQAEMLDPNYEGSEHFKIIYT